VEAKDPYLGVFANRLLVGVVVDSGQSVLDGLRACWFMVVVMVVVVIRSVPKTGSVSETVTVKMLHVPSGSWVVKPSDSPLRVIVTGWSVDIFRWTVVVEVASVGV
jgi:hypothetical protein